ncbi:hypothetical protein DIPPA_04972 [Diplonema papillatum]|nr:hypothetical protein DIPPA_04972 [Diplonema papillatum]KAJ9466169.1 hypothetical protein DIPPA_04972 [Diplonema papillatum]
MEWRTQLKTRLVENGWLHFTDEEGNSRILACHDGELCWRKEHRPGEWHSIKPPLRYNPKQRQLYAIGFSRPVALPLLSPERRRQHVSQAEALKTLQLSAKAHHSDEWCLPDGEGAGVGLRERQRELRRAASCLAQPAEGSAEEEGVALAVFLRQLARLATQAKYEHNILITATVRRQAKLHPTPSSTPSRCVLSPGEKVLLLSIERGFPRTLRVASEEYPAVTGDYTLCSRMNSGRPMWDWGGFVLCYSPARCGWVLGWGPGARRGTGYLVNSFAKLPHAAPAKSWKYQTGDGWACAGETVVEAGQEPPASPAGAYWALVQAGRHDQPTTGYVRMTCLEPTDGSNPARTPQPTPEDPDPPAACLAAVMCIVALGIQHVEDNLRRQHFLDALVAGGLAVLAAAVRDGVALKVGSRALVMVDGGLWAACTVTGEPTEDEREAKLLEGPPYAVVRPLGSYREIVAAPGADRGKAAPREYTDDKPVVPASRHLPPDVPGKRKRADGSGAESLSPVRSKVPRLRQQQAGGHTRLKTRGSGATPAAGSLSPEADSAQLQQGREEARLSPPAAIDKRTASFAKR